MKIYEKKVNNERALYGTEGAVTASDTAVTYKDQDGNASTFNFDGKYYYKAPGAIKDAEGNRLDWYVGDTRVIPAAGVYVEPSKACSIISFTVGAINGEIATLSNDISVKYDLGADLPTSISATIKVSAGATVNPASDTSVTLTDHKATYVVTAEDGVTTKTYTVTVSNKTE